MKLLKEYRLVIRIAAMRRTLRQVRQYEATGVGVPIPIDRRELQYLLADHCERLQHLRAGR